MRAARILAGMVLVALCASAPAFARSGPVDLGTAMNSWALNGADGRYATNLLTHQAMTPESEVKLDALQPSRGRFEFARADSMVDWALGRGKRVHGSTLIWCLPDDDQWAAPDWLIHGTWTRAELLELMEIHITTVMRHFRGRITSWDVVNEAWASDGTLRDCVWRRVIGPDYVEHAYRFARAADPGAKLFYNETRADIANTKFRAMEAMAADFLARGVPLDGIGLQMHVFGSSYPQWQLQEAMDRIGALGLPVHVSELDVTTSQLAGTAAEKLALQGQAYRTVAGACAASPACVKLTTWGFTDAWSWRGAAEMALPLDSEYRPKPAWHALQDELRPAPPSAGDRAPLAPGAPAAVTPNRGTFTVSWAAATDPDGERVTYRLEHRDADDAGWSVLASGIPVTTYSFTSSRLERQGTQRYRVRAEDGALAGAWSAESAAIVVDRTDPAAPAIRPDRAAETAADGGWWRDAVTLSFAAAGDPALPDGSPGSGVDPGSLPAPARFATTGSHSASGALRDRAGNGSRSASRTVKVDAAAPDGTATTGYAAGAWTNADVAVTFTCSDVGSGPSGPASTTVTVATEGAAQQARHSCADRVGHSTAVAFGPVNIDRTPPAAPRATTDRAAEDAAGGWFRDRVVVSFAADDLGGSGVHAASVPAPVELATEGAHAVRATVRDRAGNASDETALTVAVDTSAPTGSLACPSGCRRAPRPRGSGRRPTAAPASPVPRAAGSRSTPRSPGRARLA